MNEVNPKRKQSIDLLSAMYQNSAVSSDCIERILRRIDDTKLKSTLQNQLDTYETVNSTVKKQLQHEGHKPSGGHDLIAKTAARGTALKTLADPSPSNVAKIMIKGSSTGIIDLTKAVNNCSLADTEVLKQANDYISHEQAYIDQMKSFL